MDLAVVDVMDQHRDSLAAMSESLSTGVTSFLPTTLTSSYEQLLRVTENIGIVAGSKSGAKIRKDLF